MRKNTHILFQSLLYNSIYSFIINILLIFYFTSIVTLQYINLYNIQSQGTQLEKIQISFNVLWTKKFKFAPFFILALTPNSQPVIKKGLISSSPLAKESISKYSNDLSITKSDLDRIKNDNAWILESKNYDHFFYDFT